MAKEKSLFRFTIPILIVALVSKMVLRRMQGPEPAACTVLRNTLLTTKKVDSWMMEKEPTKSYDVPHIPFQVIKDCGARSFKMPYAYKFTFLENPLSEDELLTKFLERNKQVEYRASTAGITALFGMTSSNNAMPQKGSFKEAWECISKSKCSMYFDNSWSKTDYVELLSAEVVDSLTHGIKFGTMFMCNLKKFTRTAALHSSPTQSLATQMTSAKTWEFVTPEVVKKYLHPLSKKALSVVDITTANETKVFENIPHFTVTAKAGEGLFFPEYWYHIVYSHPGLNIMTNWRQINTPLDSFRNSPYPFFKSLKFAALGFVVQLAPRSLVVKIHAMKAPRRKNAAEDMYREMIYRASVNGEQYN